MSPGYGDPGPAATDNNAHPQVAQASVPGLAVRLGGGGGGLVAHDGDLGVEAAPRLVERRGQHQRRVGARMAQQPVRLVELALRRQQRLGQLQHVLPSPPPPPHPRPPR